MSLAPGGSNYRRALRTDLPLWKRIVRHGGKRYLAWKYRHFRPDSEPDLDVKIAALRLHVKRGIFNPSLHFTSGVLASYLKKPGVITNRMAVLDLGTGTGVLAVTAALAGAQRVVAVDINPDAVSCAAINVKRYNMDRIVTVWEGDMFAGVAGEKFDLVVCNPPYFRGEPSSMAERAFQGGPGLEWIARFARELQDQLSPTGSAVISLGDAADIPAIITVLEDNDWSWVAVDRRDLLVETVYLFRLTSRKR